VGFFAVVVVAAAAARAGCDVVSNAIAAKADVASRALTIATPVVFMKRPFFPYDLRE
jgi:hypothetical protein